jgi:hypothetical protein
MLPTKFRFIWSGGFRGEDFFRNQPIRRKNCLWRPCLLMDLDEMSNRYRGPSIDTFYQVLVHLVKRFQRRRLQCEKLTDDGQQTTDAKWWQKLILPLARWAKHAIIIAGSDVTILNFSWTLSQLNICVPYKKIWYRRICDLRVKYTNTTTT